LSNPNSEIKKGSASCKLADRITNLQPPPVNWDKEKILAYWEESKLILNELGDGNDYLAARLQTLISSYVKFI